MGSVDVLIIGGGPGGLSVATGLARQLYTAVVFDSGVYSNARTNHMHNVLTWDHRSPVEFRAKARADLLARYETIQFQDVQIESIRRNDSGRFEAVDSKGMTWTGRKVVLAVGAKVIYPDIPGYDDVWGRGVYACLFCHGYEDRGVSSAAVLAIGNTANVPPALHVSRMAKRLTSNVVIYTNGSSELGNQIQTALSKDAVFQVDHRVVTRLEKVAEDSSEVIVHLDDGSRVSHGFIVNQPKTRVNGTFVEQLGLELNEMGSIKTVNMVYETTAPGVFAVGDCATHMAAVANAAAMGAFAAGGLVAQLGAE
ncbi:related to thioredoxin reductase [Ramularia collo-cygni]|uniref:Related to thioredoxin reductase n=1 Tax=Ramularia collo-cygni TaxID=112498 RepID=A0A2D3VGZ0_9PEZI|nr:related to thioredoxin reductase [Ramularia collo-cygni]CZT21179.1 related to thioredoxin reductase [Ramularia collo-cygni]